MSDILVCEGKSVNHRFISHVVAALDKGGVVVLPTETGYCFAGLARHRNTHPTLLKLRGAHPRHKPFSLLCSDAKQVGEVAQLSTTAYRVLNKVLPGPFTLVLPANRNTPKTSEGEFRGTVGIRISANPIAQSVCQMASAPLMVTSVTDAEEILAEGYIEPDFETQLERWWTHAEGILLHSQPLVSVIIAGAEPLPLHVSTILKIDDLGSIEVVRDGGWDYRL